ncbi:hypothetical protein C0J52_03147 [Blattella germanica]|nr:hypothetical protein C0J52_03147 [Blattella germanica]
MDESVSSLRFLRTRCDMFEIGLASLAADDSEENGFEAVEEVPALVPCSADEDSPSPSFLGPKPASPLSVNNTECPNIMKYIERTRMPWMHRSCLESSVLLRLLSLRKLLITEKHLRNFSPGTMIAVKEDIIMLKALGLSRKLTTTYTLMYRGSLAAPASALRIVGWMRYTVYESLPKIWKGFQDAMVFPMPITDMREICFKCVHYDWIKLQDESLDERNNNPQEKCPKEYLLAVSLIFPNKNQQ